MTNQKFHRIEDQAKHKEKENPDTTYTNRKRRRWRFRKCNECVGGIWWERGGGGHRVETM